jgi:hypothetical protein
MTSGEAESAAVIQDAIDALGPAGGRVILPPGEIVLDRGIELPSHVTLEGQGASTVLRKAPGHIYPLTGYHNYGMRDVPLTTTEGLVPGMTVAIRDDQHGGFYETFARITWVEETWVGLDRGLHSDYRADMDPVLVTSYPLIFAIGAEDVAVRNLALDGNRDQQPAGIGACRGAALYALRTRGLTVTGVEERAFKGEGLGFQMCSDVHIADCRFADNTGNGYHPGAGSTGVRFDRCVAADNGAAGFFFCVRANHVTVRDSTFVANRVCGVSVGTRDSHNLLERCAMKDNDGPGLLFRETEEPVAMHDCRIAGCKISGNAGVSGHGQVDVLGEAHDLELVRNEIRGSVSSKPGIFVSPSAHHVRISGNHITDCNPDVDALSASLEAGPLSLECGADSVRPHHTRHLPPPANATWVASD